MRHQGVPSWAGWAMPELTCQRLAAGTVVASSSCGWRLTGRLSGRVCQSMRLPQSWQRLGWALRTRRVGLSEATRRARWRWWGRLGVPSHRRPDEAVEDMAVKVTGAAPQPR